MRTLFFLLALCVSVSAATTNSVMPLNYVAADTNGVVRTPKNMTITGKLNGNSSSSSISKVIANRRYHSILKAGAASIQSTLDSITDAGPNRLYLIYIPNGTYNETFRLPSWIDIAGESKDGTIIQSSSGTADTIWWDGGYNLIRDLTVKHTHNIGDSGAKQYPIHADAVSTSGLDDGSAELVLYNVKLSAEGTDAKSGIGFGLWANQRAWMINCESYSSYIYGIYAHNWTNQTARCELYIIDTYAHNLAGGGCPAFQFSNLNSGQPDCVVLEGSTITSPSTYDLVIWNDTGYGGAGEAWVSIATNCVYTNTYFADTNKIVKNIPIRIPFSSISYNDTVTSIGKVSTGRYGYGNGQVDVWGETGGINAGGDVNFRMRVNAGNANSIIGQISPRAYSHSGHNSLNFSVGTYNNDQDPGAPKVTILDNGYIGLGRTNPVSELDMEGSLNVRSNAAFAGSVKVASTNENSLVNLGNPWLRQGDVSMWSTNFGAGELSKIEWRAHPAGASDSYVAKISPHAYSPTPENRLDFYVGEWTRAEPITTPILSILSSGRGGINDTNPAAEWSVKGDQLVSGSIGINTGTNRLARVQVDVGDVLVRPVANTLNASGLIIKGSIAEGSYTNYGVALGMIVENAETNGYGMQIFTKQDSGSDMTEKVRITRTGQLLVGKTNGTELVEVDGNVVATNFYGNALTATTATNALGGWPTNWPASSITNSLWATVTNATFRGNVTHSASTATELDHSIYNSNGGIVYGVDSSGNAFAIFCGYTGGYTRGWFTGDAATGNTAFSGAVSSAGGFTPSADNTSPLGDSTHRFSELNSVLVNTSTVNAGSVGTTGSPTDVVADVVKANTISGTSNNGVNGVIVDATGSIYFGPIASDGTWRMRVVSGNFVMELRESGTYVAKHTITP